MSQSSFEALTLLVSKENFNILIKDALKSKDKVPGFE